MTSGKTAWYRKGFWTGAGCGSLFVIVSQFALREGAGDWEALAIGFAVFLALGMSAKWLTFNQP